jgi:hypothetical protein
MRRLIMDLVRIVIFEIEYSMLSRVSRKSEDGDRTLVDLALVVLR